MNASRQTGIEQLRASLKPANQGEVAAKHNTLLELRVHGRDIPCLFVGVPTNEQAKSVFDSIVRIESEGINYGQK